MIEFLRSVYTNEIGSKDEFWECKKHEFRTIKALEARKLVIFEDEDTKYQDETFFAKLTEDAWKWLHSSGLVDDINNKEKEMYPGL